MRFVGKLGVNTLHIMVVHEIVKIQVAHVLQIFHSMCDLEIVVVVVAAVKCLVQGIVGNAVQGASIYPAAVIAVDYLAHQPEIRFHFFSSAAKLFHEIKIQNISSIETNSIHIELRNPETDHIADIVLYIRIALV